MNSIRVRTKIERWPLRKSFQITGYRFENIDVVTVELGSNGHTGNGEAVGVYYRNETPNSMIEQIESIRAELEAGVDRISLMQLLPPGGARNAVDSALWDLEAKCLARDAFEIAGLSEPRPLTTTFTCGADSPENMAAAARGYTQARAIKLKLTGEMEDAERVRMVRQARPDVWLCVDGNQGFGSQSLDALLATLLEARVKLIEQPFPVDQDAMLEGMQCPIPIAADESVQCMSDLETLVGRFSAVNIKLDKCGGLTEGLAMIRAARQLGLDTMVGNMMGTSLAMAPAYLLGQLCSVVDLDGPVLLKDDRDASVEYIDGYVTCPRKLWGAASR